MYSPLLRTLGWTHPAIGMKHYGMNKTSLSLETFCEEEMGNTHDGSVCMLYEWFAIHHQQKPQFCARINLPAPYGSVMGHGSMLRELRDQSNNPIVVWPIPDSTKKTSYDLQAIHPFLLVLLRSYSIYHHLLTYCNSCGVCEPPLDFHRPTNGWIWDIDQRQLTATRAAKQRDAGDPGSDIGENQNRAVNACVVTAPMGLLEPKMFTENKLQWLEERDP